MVSKNDINNFARRLNNVNTNLLKALYEAESLIRNEVYTKYFDANENEEILKKLATTYKNFSKDNEDFVDVAFYEATFKDLKEFADKLSNID